MPKPTKKAKVAVEVDVVSQDIVSAIYSKRAEAHALAEKLNAAKKEIEVQEAALLARIKGGAQVAPGAYIAGIESAPGRCAPKWKDEAILLAGIMGKTSSEYECSIKAKYPPKMVESLMITKIG